MKTINDICINYGLLTINNNIEELLIDACLYSFH